MSYYFTLTGRKTSTLRCSFSSPLMLDKDKEYVIGLTQFVTYNAIYNVTERNNVIELMLPPVDSAPGTATEPRAFFIPEGAYEIETLEKTIQEMLPKDSAFRIIVNESTGKVRAVCRYEISFYCDRSITGLLGFRKGDNKGYYLLDKRLYQYDAPYCVNISEVDLIKVSCNLVHNSFVNGQESHVLHCFPISVPFGYKIIEQPTNVVYLPVNRRFIEELSVDISDQRDLPLDLRDEEITVVLHLKQVA